MEEVYTKQGFSKYEIYCIGKEHFQNYEVTPAKHAQKKIAYHKDFTCHIPLSISKTSWNSWHRKIFLHKSENAILK